MQIAYFHIFSGISGNMILGALLDAGLELSNLAAELKKLGLKNYTLEVEKTVKKGVSGSYVEVKTAEDNSPARDLADIRKIITTSQLDDTIQEQSLKIFQRLAEAEAKIHNTTPEEIHFHEVGAIDAIIDIVGAVIGIQHLGIEAIHCSRVHTGRGFVDCAHGRLPIPAPATLELLQGVPIYSTGIESELVTPTGAAIITTLAEQFGDLPLMRIESIGYGAGSRDLEIPNLLRISIGGLLRANDR
ncbi:nickel pincer cofactor biosynthesis protein LarC [Fuchsiella alkaliacetigena]|uniref:nickel pincer cofactor biosynthesis protein LarC n=1 Tax=Fuchsiella alkaliacetigena TaxID=957042 RepID=UPI00200A14A1|nr:nickel pincer cofactor biosynthesis protein LarC [Fuchsiella alkaliacetigena]MCK8824098.1 nickel pincer cofactor biosynthesis protein LarC [Fuchsiella alkaliacetigena]